MRVSDGVITFYIPTFGDGGVEHMMVNIARGVAGHGATVDFLIKDTRLPYLASLPETVRVVPMGGGTNRRRLERLLDYLANRQPAVLVSAKGRDDRIALRARKRYKGSTRFFLRTGTNISARLQARGRGAVRRWLKTREVRRMYARADGIICVSRGVADDLLSITGLPPDSVKVLKNPVVLPELFSRASAPLEHPWFNDGSPPVILGAGGLRRQKNFQLLLEGFSRVRSERSARLVILGEGHLRPDLERQVRELGIAGDVELAGFQDNPYAWMARSALFVLSSWWEGSPNVLVEAMAVGTPVVATDCPSGPAEILQGGRYGALVPVGDAEKLAAAMLETLAQPLPGKTLREATADYTLDNSAGAYLEALGMIEHGVA